MKSYMYFIRGMGTGVVAGMGIAVAVKCLCTKNKKVCKRTGKAAKAVSEIMSDIQQMLS